MATKSKDSNGSNNTAGRREKVALTTSNSKPKAKSTTTTTSSSTLKPTTSSSTLKPSSSSSDKPIPNYLKHTKSSLHDSGPSPKPALVRRRSFDNKAPRAQTKPISERLAQQPTRSSSFSRAPRSSVGPTPRPLYSKAPKKGSAEAFVRKEAPSATTDNDLVAIKVKEEDQHDDHVQHDDITTVSEELVVVKSDHGDHNDVGVEEDHHDENKSEESHDHGDENGKENVSIVGSEDAISVAEESVKEDDKAVSEEDHHLEINNDHDGTDNKFEIHQSDINGDKESLAEDNEGVVDISVVVDDGDGNMEEAKKDEELGGELGKKSEEDGKKGISGSSSSSSENKKNGKKESQVAYNDVIEETASKLLEKRKNKVKALVGAFETVIDYETAANNK